MEDELLRYCRQVVLKAMNAVRARMRGSGRMLLKGTVNESEDRKADDNLTSEIDDVAEQLIFFSLGRKLQKLRGIGPLAVFSEEAGIQTFPTDFNPEDADWVAFIDPIDGTEFIESLQGGWTLIALYDRRDRVNQRVAVAVAGDLFLNRVFWASQGGPAEGLDFVTHSWFKLDGGPKPKKSLNDGRVRVNMLTTKVHRFRAVAEQQRLLDAMEETKGRINLSWGSNMIVQVAAGYADAAVEFAKGFATYDVLPGLFIGERAGLTILDLDGNRITSNIDVCEIFSAHRKDPKKPKRIRFVAAKEESLAREIVDLINH
jgi:myo-inositol-1(or 4)-monophosphatase